MLFVDATPGQILVVPANTPHKFVNFGPEPLHTVNIHESPRIITEWLEHYDHQPHAAQKP